MRKDPWQISAAVAGAALIVALVAPDAWRPVTAATGKLIGTAFAQPKPVPRPVPIPSPDPPKKDEPPAVRIKKVLDKARQTLMKAPRDEAGHRDKALKAIGVAINECTGLGTDSEGGDK